MDKIGFIGLGVMGAPMAGNLSSKYDIIVFDIDTERMQLVPKAEKVSSIVEVAKSAEIIFLSLPDSETVHKVVLGDGGLLENLNQGCLIIDTSTTSPSVTKEISRNLENKGIDFLDSPVSGGEKAAIEGTLSLMVGGKEETFNRSLEVLYTIGSSIVRVGESGMGEVAKLVNNLIVGITFVAIAEGFTLGVKSGLDPSVLYEAIRGGWAESKVLDVSAEAMLKRDFNPGGTVNIHWKDLAYALTLAREEDVPLPATALAHEIFKAARASGKGKLSQPAIVNLWEELLKIQIGG
ncbi:MAG: NAD-binding protein [Dehalococcoidales bacterium]|nr:NAD-binding protein [Dehalococcoidales bacterium]